MPAVPASPSCRTCSAGSACRTTSTRRRRPAPRRPSGARSAPRAWIGSGAPRCRSTEAASTRRSRSACGATARSCSTARSATPAATGPATQPTPRRSRPPRHAVHRLLREQGDHRVRRPQADRARPDRPRRPVAEHFPEYERHGKGEITIGHVLSHRAGVPNLPARRSTSTTVGDRDFLVEALRDAKPFAARASASPTTRSRAVHPRRGRRAGHRQVDPRGTRRGVPRSARLPLDQLRGRRPRTSSASG